MSYDAECIKINFIAIFGCHFYENLMTFRVKFDMRTSKSSVDKVNFKCAVEINKKCRTWGWLVSGINKFKRKKIFIGVFLNFISSPKKFLLLFFTFLFSTRCQFCFQIKFHFFFFFTEMHFYNSSDVATAMKTRWWCFL